MSRNKLSRRAFTNRIALAAAGAALVPVQTHANSVKSVSEAPARPSNLRIGLNAYSFDKPLRDGSMTIEALLEFCALTGFGSVDLTAYYFPEYPAVPSDKFLYNIKKKAFRLGIDLGCTGVKNDFTWADPAKRQEEKTLVKNWIVAAEKLGLPGVRIFAGTLSKENIPREDRERWIADDIRECADFAGEHGVMLALQNHNDFLKTSQDVDRMFGIINHEWVGLMLDIGSYHTPDPYKDIEANSKYAITWQMKEKVFISEKQVDTDYNKVIRIVKDCGFSGYLPLETLGEGDPYQKVEVLYNKVKAALAAAS
jgi:sugar phosphate isomerase/epimerase